MKEKQITLAEAVAKFDRGDFDSTDICTQIDAGWFDWFCKDTSLPNKTKKLYTKVKQIMDSPKFDKNKVYVFFKNNCPMSGSLYDSFSIVDIESPDVLFWITPSNGHNCDKGKAQVASKESDFENVVNGSWKDVKDFFMK